MKSKLFEKKNLLVGSIILLFSFLAFIATHQTFNLAQGGDDWGIHYLVYQYFDVGINGIKANYFNPLNFLCTYCPNYYFLSLISRTLGYDHFYYFLASLIARIITATSIFILISKITKKTVAGILAGSFFAVSYIGIESTDWAFNYNHILGIAILCFFFIWYFKAKETFKLKYIAVYGLLYSLALIVSPPRMHGMIPLVLLIELGWFFVEGRKFNLKQSAIRVLIIMVINYTVLFGINEIFVFFRDKLGVTYGMSDVGAGAYGAREWNTQRINDGINFLTQEFGKGHSDLIVDPIGTIGNYIMPDRLWSSIPFSQISFLGKEPFTFFSYIFPISLFYGGLSFIVLSLIGLRKKYTILYVFILSLWMMFIYFLQRINLNTFSYPRIAFSLIGGFAIIFSIWFFFLLKRTKPLLAHTFLLGFGWMTTPIVFPWIIEPTGLILSWARYSIHQAAGLSIWLSVIFIVLVEILNKTKRLTALGFIYFAIILFTFMHIKFANDYLYHVSTYRNKDLDTNFWNYITSEVPTADVNSVSVFLFLTDDASSEITEAIRFGFYGRGGIYYKTQRWETGPLAVVNQYDNILGSVYNGKYLAKHGRKIQPLPIDHVYAFALQNKKIYNVTKEIREKLKVDLEALNTGSLTLPPSAQ